MDNWSFTTGVFSGKNEILLTLIKHYFNSHAIQLIDGSAENILLVRDQPRQLAFSPIHPTIYPTISCHSYIRKVVEL